MAVACIVVMAGRSRGWAGLFLAAMAITAYEMVMVATVGATVGKLALKLRVVELDRAGRPSWGAAARRGFALGSLQALLFPIIGLLLSVLLSPLRRGVHDRLARTYVVGPAAPARIEATDLLAYAELEEAPTWTPRGLAPSLDTRRRARLHRLDDAPWLVLGVLLLAAAVSFPVGQNLTRLVLITSVLWLPLFVVDETWRIARFGATAGHRQAGLVVVDTRTGEPPSAGRSFVRALLVGLALYVPPLWPLLTLPDVITMAANPHHRGLHDLIAGTVVVVDPHLDPTQQRARALAVGPDVFTPS